MRKDPGNEEAQLIKGVVYLAEKENAKARAHFEGPFGTGDEIPRSLPAPGFDAHAGEGFPRGGRGSS